MIDPQEAVIRFLSNDAELKAIVDTRVAAKHRYGVGWTVGTAGLMVRLDGGPVDLYVPMQALRYEVRCYAASPVEAMRIWKRLVAVSRETQRVRVTVSDGTALLYRFIQDSGPSQLYDDDIKMDCVLSFFSAAVAEESCQ